MAPTKKTTTVAKPKAASAHPPFADMIKVSTVFDFQVVRRGLLFVLNLSGHLGNDIARAHRRWADGPASIPLMGNLRPARHR